MSRALIALLMLTTAAQADTIIQCEDGSALIKRSGSRGDMVVYRPGEIDIAIPFRATLAYGRLWTPRQKLAELECTDATAPCALEANGDSGLYYQYTLDPGRTVDCFTN